MTNLGILVFIFVIQRYYKTWIEECFAKIVLPMYFQKLISKILYSVMGWKVGKNIPADIKKCVIVAAPHTSNWDFPFAMGCMYLMNKRVRFFAKESLFSFPLGIIMRATGGIAVNRSQKNNLVQFAVEQFQNNDEMYIIVPVEGTRSLVEHWRSGFYHIALQAKVPIMPGYLDYQKKEGGFFEPFYPTGDYEKDVKALRRLYKDVAAKHPELSNLHLEE